LIRGTPRGVSLLEAPQVRTDLAATMARTAVAGRTVTADIDAVIARITHWIYGAGKGGPADESARGEYDSYGAKNESLHDVSYS
jgi:aromatic ring-opening dioxygenase catalytic subunit (LigB family)